ncbi:Hypothetical protein SCF082_LOCUS17620 [Durusdinium trenchii]|uniref:CID domain-containing protein n=1 Tax=Durusdinium trenchii TaxID=1381693 RepID=A0ABP0KKE8_9DINO
MANAAIAAAAVGLAPDLKKRVEIMAEHVAKNGVDFETTVRGKNAQNPQFQFLLGGEGSEYYQALLASHRTSTPGRGRWAPPTLNGAAGAGAPPNGAAGAAQLSELMQRWPTPEVMFLSPEHERQLTEILSSLEKSSSRDAIAIGRAWVEARVDLAPALASNIMKRMVFLSSSLHRLHVLYLLHDIFIHETGRLGGNPGPLISAFKPCLVWMARPTYQIAQSMDSEGCEKIRKLLNLWVEKSILTPQEAEEISILMAAKDLPSPPSGRLLQQVGVQMGMSVSQMQGQNNLVGNILGALAPADKPPAAPPPAPAPGALVPCQALAPRPPGVQPPMPGMPGPAGLQLALASGALALPSAASETPESVPVGVMSSMLKQVSRRGKDLHAAFVPYRPLDPFYTPQTVPPLPSPSPRILERLSQFYRAVGEAARSRSPTR